MGSTWRSPLSILMGARRHDDADLELRRPPSSAPPTSSAAVAATATATEAAEERPGLFSSYSPFRYFRRTASSPSPDGADAGDGHGAPALPPMGAFPPPIADPSAEHIDDGRDGDCDADENHRQDIAHPWFHHLELADTNHEDGVVHPPDGPPDFDATRSAPKRTRLTWEERKAILNTTFNFANSIIGAGAMGVGGAFAASGGGISVLLLLGFAYLTKLSLDLVVQLSSCPSVIQTLRSQEHEPISDGSLSSHSDSARSEPIPAPGAHEIEEPLLAKERGDMTDAAHPVRTPSNSEGLGGEHPLVRSPERPEEEDRYDLTMGTTHPNPFSALALNGENLPVVESMCSIRNDTSAPQRHLSMSPCTYEELGYAAYGAAGRSAVLVSKALYSFGCLIAYVVVVRDNFGPALRQMVVGSRSPNVLQGEEDHGILYDDGVLAFWVSALVMLPLSCPRTMKPLAKFSFVSLLSIVFLVFVVVYLYFACANPQGGTAGRDSFGENWLQIRSFSGLMESLGCFVFTFVCHHTVNLAYETLPAPIRTPAVWSRVSANGISLALQASLAIGIFAYLTFGSQTAADVLMGYPADLILANVARLLLCLCMALTFPLPFLTCREMSVLIAVDMHRFYHANKLDKMCCAENITGNHNWQTDDARRASGGEAVEGAGFVHTQSQRETERGSVRHLAGNYSSACWEEEDHIHMQPLLSEMEHEPGMIQLGEDINPSPLSSRSGGGRSKETTTRAEITPPSWLLDGGRQLTLPWHSALTFALWLVVTLCAIQSPSLGDVLDLVGAATGTMLAFVLPALFSFRLRGLDRKCVAILGIGGSTGLLGTLYSCVKLAKDAARDV